MWQRQTPLKVKMTYSQMESSKTINNSAQIVQGCNVYDTAAEKVCSKCNFMQ